MLLCSIKEIMCVKSFPGLSIPFSILNCPVCNNGILHCHCCGKNFAEKLRNPLQFDMPCLCQSQVPALFAGVKSSWIRGFAVPIRSGLRKFAIHSRIFANLNLLAHVQIQRSKMLFTPSKQIMQGGPLAKKSIL